MKTTLLLLLLFYERENCMTTFLKCLQIFCPWVKPGKGEDQRYFRDAKWIFSIMLLSFLLSIRSERTFSDDIHYLKVFSLGEGTAFLNLLSGQGNYVRSSGSMKSPWGWGLALTIPLGELKGYLTFVTSTGLGKYPSVLSAYSSDSKHRRLYWQTWWARPSGTSHWKLKVSAGTRNTNWTVS